MQNEILDLIGQFTSVVGSLDQKWATALLRRSQLADPQFLAQLLDTIRLLLKLLAYGPPVPYLFDPLLERYRRASETLSASNAHRAGEGVPDPIDIETLCSANYLGYSCGVNQIFGVVTRLDHAMLVAKALVGEKLIVYGPENLDQPRTEYLAPSMLQEDCAGLRSCPCDGDKSRRCAKYSLA